MKRDRDENPKAQALARLDEKIELARKECETTDVAVVALKEAVAGKIRDDGAGRSDYGAGALAADRAAVVEAERGAQFARDTLQTLESLIPELTIAAAREELGGIDADLTRFDSEALTPALSRFREVWNGMLVVLEETQQVYKARDAMLARFKALVKELPCEEQAATHPSLPFWLRPSFTTVLEKAGVQELRPLREVDFEKRARESWPVEAAAIALRAGDPVNKESLSACA